MAKRRGKFPAIKFSLAVFAMATLAFVVLKLTTKRELSPRKIAVNGQEIEFLQSGHGPHLIVLTPETDERDWNPIARSWVADYTLSVIKDARPETLTALLQEINAKNVYLLGFDRAASHAIERAAELKERISKLILISPKLDDSWKWRASVSSIAQPTLLLWGRNDPEIKSQYMKELNHGLRNAQMSFHPQSKTDLLVEQPDWVTGKVRNFIQHTR